MCEQRRRTAAAATALWVLVAALLGMYLVLFGLEAAQRLARPQEELMYGESWLLDGARHVAQGDVLYAPVDRVPFMQIAYTPLFYVVVGGLQRVLGDHGYTIGRAVSLVASLVAAGTLAWSVRQLTGRWRVGLLAALLFLTQNLTVALWASLDRVDVLALALTLIGLALQTARRSSLAAVFLLAAFFTKQTFIVAPLACAIVLWPDRAALQRFAAVFVGGVAAGCLAAQLLSHGWFVWHTVTANGNEPDPNTLSILLGSFLQFNGLPVLAALGSLVLPSAPTERVWRLYFVGSLLTLPTIAKLGASSNYWLELTAATAVLLAIAACRLACWPLARLVAPTLIAGSLLIAVPGYQASAADITDTLRARPGYLSLIGDAGELRVDAAFVDQLAREPGDLLTDNSGLSVAAGKRIAYEFQIFQLVQAEGHWSDAPIVAAIDAQNFSLVALMHPLGQLNPRMTPAVEAALERAYLPAGDQSGFWLYRPRR